MKWTDDLLLEHQGPDLRRGQLQLAMYANHLSSGHNIYCKQLKLTTIRHYISAAAKFLARFSGKDYRRDNPGDKSYCPLLNSVFKDIGAFETLPNRREPYTLLMHTYVSQLAAPERLRDPTSLLPALADCFGQAINGGFRRLEWSQPQGSSDPLRPLQNYAKTGCRTKAFVPNDYRVILHDYTRLVGLAILSRPLKDIAQMFLKWRYQKNQQNGEERLYTPNKDPTAPWCFVSNVYRSLERFQALMSRDRTLNPATTPLAVYWHPQSESVRLITCTDTERLIRDAAAHCYKLHPVNDKTAIMRWSSHSFRVGACVLLHSMGFSVLDIQWLLRWLSNAFAVYLRNTTVLADKHQAALDRAAAMPHFPQEAL
jgi:hypothetical protein